MQRHELRERRQHMRQRMAFTAAGARACRSAQARAVQRSGARGMQCAYAVRAAKRARARGKAVLQAQAWQAAGACADADAR